MNPVMGDRPLLLPKKYNGRYLAQIRLLLAFLILIILHPIDAMHRFINVSSYPLIQLRQKSGF
ncbi:MAG: hypothetical protein AAGA75_27070 [Cyanobacteria bacterium P01_E01_bin.6]